MEDISFACISCKQMLKVGADKAGRKTKCKKCGAELTIPKANAKPAEKPAAKNPLLDEDESDGGTYDVSESIEAPKDEKPKKKKRTDDDDEDDEDEDESPKKKKDKRPPGRKKLVRKSVQFADDWRKLQVALVLIFSGMCAWGLNWLLRMILFLLGVFATSAYASTVQTSMAQAAGEADYLHVPTLVMGLIAGLENLSGGKALIIVEQIVALGAGGVFMAGYFICLAIPNVNGTRGLAIALICLSGVNLFLNLLLLLLPAVGAMPYVMVPFFGPEVAMNEAGIERILPLHVFWCAAPFWEVFATILFQAAYFAEPILFCVLLRAIAKAVKDDVWLEPRALALLRLGFGQFFVLLAYNLFSLTGTSEVMHLVLIAVYLLWRAFLVGFIIQFSMTVWQSRSRLESLLEEE